MSIYLAAKLLQLPYSTAKAISKRYENEGIIFRPKQKKAQNKQKTSKIQPIANRIHNLDKITKRDTATEERKNEE